MTLDEIVKLMNDKYVAATGLGRLPNPEKDTSIAPNGVESCRNENGLLYRMLAVIQAYRAGATLDLTDLIILRRALVSLRRFPNQPVPTNRQPYGDKVPTLGNERDSHDNAIALLLAGMFLVRNEIAPNLFLDQNTTAPSLIDHWWHNWFCIDNLNPGKFSFEAFRQPGEVAIYYIAAGRRAPFLFTLWMLVGIFLNARKVYPNGEASRLTFMRLFLIDQIGIKGFVQRWLYGKVSRYWFRRLAEKFGKDGISPIMMEYGAGHPIAEYQRIIDERSKV